jgi:hypothetical protein
VKPPPRRNRAYQQAEHDGRMRALDAFLRHYEGRHGVITDDEIRQAARRARENAFVVRGKKFDRATRVSK